MRARITLLAAPLVLALAACGGSESEDGNAGGASPPSSAADTAPPGISPDGDEGAAGSTPDQRETPDAKVRAVESEFGRILVDGSGRTLYGFTKDKEGASNCDTDCIAVWPAMITSSEVAAGEGLEEDLLTGVEQSGGITQATYGEWPLYYYVGDAAPGDINGQGLDEEWFVVAPDGKLIKTG
jgi:predicted lipoprotein with Yx(FWY)xxD motif